MGGKQSFAAFAGLALVFANLWVGPEKAGLTQLSQGNFSAGLSTLKTSALELLLIVVATMVAGISDGAASVMLALILGLWLLFLINRFGSGQKATFGAAGKPATTSTTSSGNTAGTIQV